MAFLAGAASPCRAQNPSTPEPDKRTQYPPLMRNGFFGISFGAMGVGFDDTHLQPGFTAGEIRVPPAAFSVTLLGHQFNPYVSAEMTYTRPMKWATFDHIA